MKRFILIGTRISSRSGDLCVYNAHCIDVRWELDDDNSKWSISLCERCREVSRHYEPQASRQPPLISFKVTADSHSKKSKYVEKKDRNISQTRKKNNNALYDVKGEVSTSRTVHFKANSVKKKQKKRIKQGQWRTFFFLLAKKKWVQSWCPSFTAWEFLRRKFDCGSEI